MIPDKQIPTDEQEAVCQAIRQGPSVEVSAYAGCAKTSTLVMAAQYVKTPSLALVFNKRNQEEMKGKFPGHFEVKTMNGLGHGAWARGLPLGTKVELDARKLGRIVSQVASAGGAKLSGDQWDGVRGLVVQAMQRGVVPETEALPGFLPDCQETWEEILDDLGLEDQGGLLVDLARHALRENIAQARAGIISFDDQVYCPTMLGGKWPKYPVVFVDEAQDLSPLNHAMLAQCVRPDGKLVVVGDEKQAIYNFRGASGDSMQRIRKLREDWIGSPLATTFRCPKRVVERHQDHAPGFRAWHTNAEGKVGNLPTVPPGGLDPEDDQPSWQWQDVGAWAPDLPSGRSLAILCRNNAPLMSMALKLIRRRVGVKMLGQDIGKALVGLSRKIAGEDETPAAAVAGAIRDWEERECALALANGRADKLPGITDRAECLRAVIDSEVRDAGELRAVITKIFSQTDGQVTLGSIHRSKGLEWDLVLHLDPWRIPSRWARDAAKAGNPVPLQQEHNLRYVAETRTRWGLVNVNLDQFR